MQLSYKANNMNDIVERNQTRLTNENKTKEKRKDYKRKDKEEKEGL